MRPATHLGFFFALIFLFHMDLQAQEDHCVRLKSQTIYGPRPAGFHNYFGEVLDISGNTLVITDIGSSGFQGRGWVYEFNGSDWQRTATLDSFTVGVGWFGKSVATDGDRIIVGANDKAYIFYRNPFGSGWSREQELDPPDIGLDGGGSFGKAVAIQGNLALVGEPDWDDYRVPGDASDSPGRVLVYRFDGTSWNFEQALRPRDPAAYDYFGGSFDLDGDTIIVGVPRKNLITEEEGATYIFEFDGSSWRQTKRLVPRPAFPWTQFGYRVRVEGDLAMVRDSGNGTDAGIDIFRKEGDDWAKIDRIAGHGVNFDFKNGELFIIGYEVGANAAGYNFHHNGNDWVKVNTFKRHPSYPWDRFRNVAGSKNFVALANHVEARVEIFPVADLGLQVTPPRPQPGEMMNLTSCGGALNGDALLVLKDHNGTPLFRRILHGRFNPEGLWEAQLGNMPPALTGSDLTFQVFSLMDPTTVVFSHESAIEVQ